MREYCSSTRAGKGVCSGQCRSYAIAWLASPSGANSVPVALSLAVSQRPSGQGGAAGAHVCRTVRYDGCGICRQLHPTDPRVRAIADTWMDWQQTVCAPMMRPVFWGLVRTPEAECDYDAINAGIERGCKVWGVLDRQLANRAFVAGDTLTMGDIPIGPQAHHWFNLVEKRSSMPSLEAWYQRLTERPAFRKKVMIPIE